MSNVAGSRGLGPVSAGLFRPSVAEPVAELRVDAPAPELVGDDTPETPRKKRRRAVGTKVLKIALPAHLAERVQLIGIQSNRKPSAVVAELIERHAPKLAIRQG